MLGKFTWCCKDNHLIYEHVLYSCQGIQSFSKAIEANNESTLIYRHISIIVTWILCYCDITVKLGYIVAYPVDNKYQFPLHPYHSFHQLSHKFAIPVSSVQQPGPAITLQTIFIFHYYQQPHTWWTYLSLSIPVTYTSLTGSSTTDPWKWVNVV